MANNSSGRGSIPAVPSSPIAQPSAPLAAGTSAVSVEDTSAKPTAKDGVSDFTEEGLVTAPAAANPDPEEARTPEDVPKGKEHWGQGGEFMINEQGIRVRVPDEKETK